MQTFDWAYFGRLNVAIVLTILVVVPAMALLPPVASAVILAGIAWFFPDLDRRFRLNNPSYLERFSELERHRHDERNKKATRITFVFLAVAQLLRAASRQRPPGIIPWYVFLFAVVVLFMLINSMEFLRYRLSLSAQTYEELYTNHMSWSRLLVTPLLVVMFMVAFWLAGR